MSKSIINILKHVEFLVIVFFGTYLFIYYAVSLNKVWDLIEFTLAFCPWRTGNWVKDFPLWAICLTLELT